MSTIICALCDATSTTEETGGLITGICHACYTSAEPAYAQYSALEAAGAFDHPTWDEFSDDDTPF